MAEDFNIGAFASSPYLGDVKKQMDAAYESAKNIRKAYETPEEYRIRREKEKAEHLEKVKIENTEDLQQRLSKIDMSCIGTLNKSAIEDLIRNAESIKFFALYNNYDMNTIDFTKLDRAVKAARLRLEYIKRGGTDRLENFYVDGYKKEDKNETSLLDKLAGGSAKANTDYGANITPNYFK